LVVVKIWAHETALHLTGIYYIMDNNFVELTFKLRTDESYEVDFRGGIEGQEPSEMLSRTVPAYDKSVYEKYQKASQKLYDYNFRLFRLGHKSSAVRTQNDGVLARQELDRCAQELMNTLNTWGNSTGFDDIKAAIESRSEWLRVTISTECAHLRRLPFHEWNLFPAGIEAVFSSIDAKTLLRPYREKIRILVILGGSAGINVEEDKKLIEEYCHCPFAHLKQGKRIKAIMNKG
jgi:hypothetical protein